jgi:hypothetical protein
MGRLEEIMKKRTVFNTSDRTAGMFFEEVDSAGNNDWRVKSQLLQERRWKKINGGMM